LRKRPEGLLARGAYATPLACGLGVLTQPRSPAARG